MTLRIDNVHPLNLKASLDDRGALVLSYDGKPLCEHGNSIFDELPKDGEGPNDEAEIVISDFTHGGITHQIFVWEVLKTGALLQWTRFGGASRSGPRHATKAEVRVVALSVPKPEDDAKGPPAPGSTQTTVKVKVKKHGSMPLD